MHCCKNVWRKMMLIEIWQILTFKRTSKFPQQCHLTWATVSSYMGNSVILHAPCKMTFPCTCQSHTNSQQISKKHIYPTQWSSWECILSILSSWWWEAVAFDCFVGGEKLWPPWKYPWAWPIKWAFCLFWCQSKNNWASIYSYQQTACISYCNVPKTVLILLQL